MNAQVVLSTQELKPPSYMEGYLTEQKLVQFLTDTFGSEDIQTQVACPGHNRLKFDALVKSKEMFVEFNGDSHYCKSSVIARDKIKEESARKSGYQVVNVPYWLQLSKDTIQMWFGVTIDNFKQPYPHGFIDDKCVLPADFCELGAKRFQQEFDSLHDKLESLNVMYEIYGSLNYKATKIENELVFNSQISKHRSFCDKFASSLIRDFVSFQLFASNWEDISWNEVSSCVEFLPNGNKPGFLNLKINKQDPNANAIINSIETLFRVTQEEINSYGIFMRLQPFEKGIDLTSLIHCFNGDTPT